MKTYKIGNKAKCIIRAYCSGTYGGLELQYDNQPYTVLNDVEVSLNFSTVNTSYTDRYTELGFNEDFLNEVRISNVLLTNRILNLIFSKSEVKSFSTSKNYISDEEKKIYFDGPDEITQVFIYNKNGELENVYETMSFTDTDRVIDVENANESYLVFYSYTADYAVSLDQNANQYLTLDIEVKSNNDDETVLNCIHVEKCCLRINKNISLDNTTNSIDLNFRVINTGKDYLILE